MRSKYYCLAFTGICLAACSPLASRTDASSDVVYVPLSGPVQNDRRPERVVIGMSRQQVETIMGASVETCWIYPAGNVRQQVCFQDGKVSSFSEVEHEPGTNFARINATFAGGKTDTHPVPPDNVAIGASTQQIRRLLGTPQMTTKQYNVGTGYRATFAGGRLTEWDPIPVPPVH